VTPFALKKETTSIKGIEKKMLKVEKCEKNGDGVTTPL